MRIRHVIWQPEIEEKLRHKHKVLVKVLGEALVISARDMERKERRLYARQ